MISSHSKYVVIGGGIAGVTCTEQLSVLQPEDKVLLLTASPLIKTITNFKSIARTLEEFDVEERDAQSLQNQHIQVVKTFVTHIDTSAKKIQAEDGNTYTYEKLCLCTGASPKIICKDNPYVLGIRDTETIKVFQEKLKNAHRIIVVGNGGIATELVYEIENCQVIWVIKSKSIGETFFDAGAAEFFLPHLFLDKTSTEKPIKRTKYTVAESLSGSSLGGALGPDWSSGLKMTGEGNISHDVHVEYQCEVKTVLTPEEFNASQKLCEKLPFKDNFKQDNWPVYVELSNGKIYGCDFIVSATGVIPNSNICQELFLAEDNGIKVNNKMETNVKDVYAAGDVCSASWELSPHWLQMRLWTQARQMGAYAAKCMSTEDPNDILLDICFDIFTHVTKFFGYKIILLGKFNSQGLGNDYELLLRVNKGVEYVKVVMKEGLMQGAVLIGETDLEEAFENLILNQNDLSSLGISLLDPNIDIEDYFD